MSRKRERDKPEFDITDRGYNVKAWHLKDTKESKGDARIRIRKDGKLIKEFLYPSYKIWNIAAHFSDIVDGELESSDSGYRIAGSNGLGGGVMPKPTKRAGTTSGGM